MQTVGVIYRTERDSFRVLDQAGQTRLVQPHQITMRRDSRRAISTDAEGNELRVGDNVKEVDGEVCTLESSGSNTLMGFVYRIAVVLFCIYIKRPLRSSIIEKSHKMAVSS